MSIVEKAMARLRAQAPATAAAAPARTSVERAVAAAPVPPSTPAASTLHIDRVALEHAGLLPADRDTGARLANELRHIKRPLLENIRNATDLAAARARRILVSSALPGEGKTFTALNLALSLAHERDFEVLLVDGDVPKCDITRACGLQGHPGLLDVLADEGRNAADVIVRSDIANLLLVPTGTHHSLAAELLGSRRMDAVLAQFAGGQAPRLVVFDSPPLLATVEAQALAAPMGQVVMVVAAGHTTRQELAAALEGLTNAQYVGLVLNKSRLPASESHYYGYYGHADTDHAAET